MFNTAYITQLLLGAVAVLITLTVHEYAHGYAAYKLGDDTAKSYGRLSLNPLKHLDPFGAVCMLLFHFGWAKPVPINPRNFKRPRVGFAITAAAGPLSNIVMAFLIAPIFLLLGNLFKYSEIPLLNSIMMNTLIFVYTFFRINIGLGIFNLLPIPPFDGSRIVNVLLPPKAYFGIMKYERYI
jgi:Zn-dependent protease